MIRIGIIGHEGKLGSHLVHMGCEHLPVWIRKDMPEINFPTENAVIINCAAMTDVDRCEIDKDYYEEAIQTNGMAIDGLAKAYKGEIIHISTDYVFKGKHGAYREYDWLDLTTSARFSKSDFPTKNMLYGLTKMVGEILAHEHENVKIVRTTGLYGGVSELNDFLNTALDAYKFDNQEILVTKELRGNQTYIPHLAEALIKYTELKVKPKVLHIASKEVITRYEFALMIANVFGLDKKRIKPCKNKDVPGWIAERPKKGGLKVDLAIKMGLPIYTILEGLEEAKKQLDIAWAVKTVKEEQRKQDVELLNSIKEKKFIGRLRGTTDWLQETFK